MNTMVTPSDFMLIAPYFDELLDIIYHRDDFTTSDLQGAIEAQLYKLVREVRNESIKHE